MQNFSKEGYEVAMGPVHSDSLNIAPAFFDKSGRHIWTSEFLL